jgi:hypothetical protein
MTTRGICKICQKAAHTNKALYCASHKEKRVREVGKQAQARHRFATKGPVSMKIDGLELKKLRTAISDLMLINKQLKKRLTKQDRTDFYYETE